VADALRQVRDGGVFEVIGLREPIEVQVVQFCSACAEMADYREALRAAVHGDPRRAECHQRLAEAWHRLNKTYEAAGLDPHGIKHELQRELEADR
jgi:hypothetical protein